jgi:hypothetical protein
MALQVLGILANLMHLGMLQIPMPGRHPGLPQAFVSEGFAVAMGLFNLLPATVVLVGAIKMKNLENYGLAMTAAIMALIPCVSPCCVLGLPFGIWALVVLSEDRVKAAFRR